MYNPRTLFAICMLFSQMAPSSSADIIDFEDKPLGPNSYFNGGPITNSNGWSSGGLFFNNNFDSAFGGIWEGWSYSNVRDIATPGFTNQFASFAGGGFGGSSNYAVAFPGTTLYLDLPLHSVAQSVRITNTTFAGLSMLQGDGFTKKFGGASGNDPDFFMLTLRGYDSLKATGNVTGSLNIFLADFRSADNTQDYVLNTWQLVDLTSLGDARSLGFTFTSTDVGAFGINTPTYFAMDQLNLLAVPEPSTSTMLLFSLGVGIVLVGAIRFWSSLKYSNDNVRSRPRSGELAPRTTRNRIAHLR